jgi:hypothetical protein
LEIWLVGVKEIKPEGRWEKKYQIIWEVHSIALGVPLLASTENGPATGVFGRSKRGVE